MKFALLVTTFSVDSLFYKRLIDSFILQDKGNFTLDIFVLEQRQNYISGVLDNAKTLPSCFIGFHTFTCSHSLPLSVARNFLLSKLFASPINPDYILFPDDDCYYKNNFFQTLSVLLSENRDKNISAYCLSVFDPITNTYYGNRKIPEIRSLTGFEITFLPISVGIVFDYIIFKNSNILFHPLLGVGSLIPSGEETFALLDLYSKGYSVFGLTSLCVFHDQRQLTNISKDFFYSLGSSVCSIYSLFIHRSPFLASFLALYLPYSLFKLLLSILTLSQSAKLYLARISGLVIGLILSLPFLLFDFLPSFSVLYIKGGLGNQLFQLVALEYFSPLFGRHFQFIDNLSYLFDKKRTPLVKISSSSVLISLIIRLLNKILNSLNISPHYIHSFSDIHLSSCSGNKLFILPSFFQDQPLNPLDDKYKIALSKVYSNYVLKYVDRNTLKGFESIDYVAVHVRRGDFVSAASGMSLLSQLYFCNAISSLPANISSLPIYVVSDDLKFCDQHILPYLPPNSKTFSSDNAFDDIFLLANAKGLCISNSTFSAFSACVGSILLNKLHYLVVPDKWHLDNPSRFHDLNLNVETIVLGDSD